MNEVLHLPAGLPAADTVRLAEEAATEGRRTCVATSDRPILKRALLGSTDADCILLGLIPDRHRTLSPARIRDVLVAAVALVVLSPVLALVGAAVGLTSRGGVLFATEVVGKEGRRFRWRKFRTMRPGNEQQLAERREQFARLIRSGEGGTDLRGPQKLVDHSRVTPVGRFLRRHSIDELPQVWNVLKGDMTLVGPRPCLPYEYDLQQDWQTLRYRVLPGLTGPWQAYGRSHISFDEGALLDYCYARAATARTDLRIMLRTVRVLLRGDGGL